MKARGLLEIYVHLCSLGFADARSSKRASLSQRFRQVVRVGVGVAFPKGSLPEG